MDKDVTVTNDGATILSLLDVEHPAGRILIELAQQQDKEVGDGTTSVVIIAAELLRRANELVKNRIHPTTIISGYRLALREATKYLPEALSTKVESLGKDTLKNIAKTSMSSKIIGRYTIPFPFAGARKHWANWEVIRISLRPWQWMRWWQSRRSIIKGR
jgi:T-complex protein 1 subunit alpha